MKFVVLNTHISPFKEPFFLMNGFFFSGRERGFIPNALWIFRSGSKSGDYRDDMNHANYKELLQEKLIRNLESKSVIVFDSASYHNVQLGRHPNQQWQKRWNAVLVGLAWYMVQLRHDKSRAVRSHRNALTAIWDLCSWLTDTGHTAIKLPSYRADLNRIEKKNWYREDQNICKKCYF